MSETVNKKVNAYGKWHVTTEGDEEGRTVRDLGVYEGYLDEIAFALGSKCFYSLRFDAAKELPPPEQAKPVKQVHVSLDISTGTWDMTSEQRQRYFAEMLAGRDVEVKDGQFYASVLLKNKA